MRTPCILPLDPPLRCCISCMTHAKILVILVFQSGRENQRATRAMRAMRRNRVLRNCSSVVLLMEYCLELRSIDRLSLIRVKRSFYITGSLLTRVKHLPYGLYGQALLRVKTLFRD